MIISSKRFLCVGLALSMASACYGQVATIRLGHTAPNGPAKWLSCRGGEGVLRFDLSALPPKAKIVRADLVLARTQPISGTDPRRLIDAAVFPLMSAFTEGAAPAVSGKPLSLRGPWFDRFDATAAVAAFSAGKPNGGFFVKRFPLLDARTARLDVMVEGKPAAANLPAQAGGLKVFHRSGQTFVTWKEIEDPVGKDVVLWGEMKRLVSRLDRQRRLRYCVYRSRRPISAETLAQAELLAEVKPLSGWNVNARNKARPRDEVVARLQQAEEQGNLLFWVKGRKGVPDECPIDRFVVASGPDPKTPGKPLRRGTGLYVHTATDKAQAYYAVVTMVNGIQNTVTFGPGNSLRQPVAEAPANPAPVIQGRLPRRPVWDYRHSRYHVVQWTAPPLGNLPSQYYNWLVCVPDLPAERYPLELNLPAPGDSYYRVPFCVEPESIVVVGHDFPLNTWYYGYHEAEGTLKSFRQGRVHNYTERRILAFVDWVARTWPVDRNRISVAGNGLVAGSGAMRLGLRHHKVFNLVMASNGCVDFRGAILKFRELGPERKVPNVERRFRVKCPEEGIQKRLGRLDWDLKTGSGRSVWDDLDLTRLVKSLPATADLPVVTTADQGGFEYERDFRLAMLGNGHLLIADFNVYGNRFLIPVSMTGSLTGQVPVEVRKDRSHPAFRGPGCAVLLKPAKLATGELVVSDGTFQWWGRFNRDYRWSDVVDRPDRYEITLRWVGRGAGTSDVTLRRLQAFKAVTGKKYAWQFTAVGGNRQVAQQGDVTVAKDGLIRIRRLRITGSPGRLVVTAK